MHWDGSAWSERALPGKRLKRIRGISSADVWAVGDSGTLLHWDGTSWTSASEIVSDFGTAGVWSDAGETWMVGSVQRVDEKFWFSYSGVALQRDGTGWKELSSGLDARLSAVWGIDSHDLWAAGDRRAFHWDGATWQAFEVAANDQAITGLWGSSSTNLWAIGSTSDSAPKAWHWNGAAWSERDVAAPSGAKLVSIWGTAANDIWVVNEGGVVLHFDGGTWAQVMSQPYPLSRVFGTGSFRRLGCRSEVGLGGLGGAPASLERHCVD
ncbi:MAG: hypothetical protein QM765_00895 [Myxococcales bacterium]